MYNYSAQKSALTKAQKKGQAAVIEATFKAVRAWQEDGEWPDDWSRWDRALSEAGTFWTVDEIAESVA